MCGGAASSTRYVLRQEGGAPKHIISVGFFEEPISQTITPGPVMRPRMFETRCPYVVVAQHPRNVQTDACRRGRVKHGRGLVDTAHRNGPVGNGETTKYSWHETSFYPTKINGIFDLDIRSHTTFNSSPYDLPGNYWAYMVVRLRSPFFYGRFSLQKFFFHEKNIAENGFSCQFGKL